MKLVVNAKVREALVELDQAFERFHRLTAQLGSRSLGAAAELDVSAELQQSRLTIVGIAWRINRASRGEGDFKA